MTFFEMSVPLAFLCFYSVPLNAQSPITTITYTNNAAISGSSYTTTANISGTTSRTYSYGNLSDTPANSKMIQSFGAAGNTYSLNSIHDGTISIRRNGTNSKSLVWMESVTNYGSSPTTIQLLPVYNDVMEHVFTSQSFSLGTDNLFCNNGTGSQSVNNIERVDWITSTGISSTTLTEAGFAFFDRGAAGQHDPFVIAPILSLNASGNPASYGTPLRVTGGSSGNYGDPTYNGTNNTLTLNFVVLEKQITQPELYLGMAWGSQEVGGVFISFAHLGITSGQTIYGYSLFGNDLPSTATAADLIDYSNNTYFPTNTNGTNGGVDLISITGLFTTSTAVVSGPAILPVNYSFWRASLQQNHVEIKWNISNPEECSGIELLESGDGRTWRKLAQVPCDQNSYLDSTFGEKNYYRLKFTDISGQVNYSSVAMASYPIKNETNKIDVFIKNKRVYISSESNERTKALLMLYDKTGRLIHRQQVHLIRGRNQTSINVILPQGIYIAHMLSDSQTWSRQFLYNP